MQFTFKRDEEGRERIYHGDALVGTMVQHKTNGATVVDMPSAMPPRITAAMVNEAIERADEAGFWDYTAEYIAEGRKSINAGEYTPEEWFGVGGWGNVINEVTVDVPVADNATLSVTLPGDES